MIGLIPWAHKRSPLREGKYQRPRLWVLFFQGIDLVAVYFIVKSIYFTSSIIKNFEHVNENNWIELRVNDFSEPGPLLKWVRIILWLGLSMFFYSDERCGQKIFSKSIFVPGEKFGTVGFVIVSKVEISENAAGVEIGSNWPHAVFIKPVFHSKRSQSMTGDFHKLRFSFWFIKEKMPDLHRIRASVLAFENLEHPRMNREPSESGWSKLLPNN